YSHVYLADMANYDAMNKIWGQYFSRGIPPARAVVGVYRMPTDTPVEITVIAMRDLSRKKAVGPVSGAVSPGVLAGDRLYLSGVPATDVQQALDSMKGTLAAAGMDFRNMVC